MIRELFGRHFCVQFLKLLNQLTMKQHTPSTVRSSKTLRVGRTLKKVTPKKNLSNSLTVSTVSIVSQLFAVRYLVSLSNLVCYLICFSAACSSDCSTDCSTVGHTLSHTVGHTHIHFNDRTTGQFYDCRESLNE